MNAVGGGIYSQVNAALVDQASYAAEEAQPAQHSTAPSVSAPAASAPQTSPRQLEASGRTGRELFKQYNQEVNNEGRSLSPSRTGTPRDAEETRHGGWTGGYEYSTGVNAVGGGIYSQVNAALVDQAAGRRPQYDSPSADEKEAVRLRRAAQDEAQKQAAMREGVEAARREEAARKRQIEQDTAAHKQADSDAWKQKVCHLVPAV